jgi:hypothetical protein
MRVCPILLLPSNLHPQFLNPLCDIYIYTSVFGRPLSSPGVGVRLCRLLPVPAQSKTPQPSEPHREREESEDPVVCLLASRSRPTGEVWIITTAARMVSCPILRQDSSWNHGSHGYSTKDLQVPSLTTLLAPVIIRRSNALGFQSAMAQELISACIAP